ncbi:MAG: hypothetical protein ACRC9U_00635 [Metamycoplasmataceae bacterium]
MFKKTLLILTPLIPLPFVFVSCSVNVENTFSQQNIDKAYSSFSNITLPVNETKNANSIYSIESAKEFIPALNKIDNMFIPVFLDYKYSIDYSSVEITFELKNAETNETLKPSASIINKFTVSGFKQASANHIKETNEIFKDAKSKISFNPQGVKNSNILASLIVKENFTIKPLNNVNYSILIENINGNDETGILNLNYKVANNNNILLPFLNSGDMQAINTQFHEFQSIKEIDFLTNKKLSEIFDFYWSSTTSNSINLSQYLTTTNLTNLQNSQFPSSIYDEKTLKDFFVIIKNGLIPGKTLVGNVPKPFDGEVYGPNPTDDPNNYFNYLSQFQYKITSNDSLGTVRVSPLFQFTLPGGNKVDVENPNKVANKTLSINFAWATPKEKDGILEAIDNVYKIFKNKQIVSNQITPPNLSIPISNIDNSTLTFPSELKFYEADPANPSWTIVQETLTGETPDKNENYYFKIVVTPLENSYNDNLGSVDVQVKLFFIEKTIGNMTPPNAANLANPGIFIRPQNTYINSEGKIIFQDADKILNSVIGGYKNIYQDQIDFLYSPAGILSQMPNTPIKIDSLNFSILDKNNALNYWVPPSDIVINAGLKIVYKVKELLNSPNAQTKTFKVEINIISSKNESVVYKPTIGTFPTFNLIFSI